MIGVDSSMKIVRNYQIKSKAKPSLYTYPKEVELADKKKEVLKSTTVLSTASRVKAKVSKRGSKLDLVKIESTLQTEEQKKLEEEKKKEADEPLEEILVNPCRITPKQHSVIEVISSQNYVPLISKRNKGYILLRKINENLNTVYYEDELTNIQISNF
jgi:26S proteasome regulatory subunit N2